MKKSLYVIFALACFAMTLSSCNKDDVQSSYAVKFIASPGSFLPGQDSVFQVSVGETVNQPVPAPVCADSYLAGWYTDNSFRCRWDFDTPISKNMNLVAKWVREFVLVTFDANGGVFTDGKTTYVDTLAQGALLTEYPLPVRALHTFTGWFTDKECLNPWDARKDVFTENVTLYAGWETKAPLVNTLKLVFSTDNSVVGTSLLQYEYDSDDFFKAINLYSGQMPWMGFLLSSEQDRNNEVLSMEATSGAALDTLSGISISGDNDFSSAYAPSLFFEPDGNRADMMAYTDGSGVLTRVGYMCFSDESVFADSVVFEHLFARVDSTKTEMSTRNEESVSLKMALTYDNNGFIKSVTTFPSIATGEESSTLISDVEVDETLGCYLSFKLSLSENMTASVKYVYSESSVVNNALPIFNPTVIAAIAMEKAFSEMSGSPFGPYAQTLGMFLMHMPYMGASSLFLPSEIVVTTTTTEKTQQVKIPVSVTIDNWKDVISNISFSYVGNAITAEYTYFE